MPQYLNSVGKRILNIKREVIAELERLSGMDNWNDCSDHEIELIKTAMANRIKQLKSEIRNKIL